MIIVDLICESGHRFEGWFASRNAFTDQVMNGQVRCPSCDSDAVRRLPSAVHLGNDESRLGSGASGESEALAAYRRAVSDLLRGSEDVGARFAEEARRIHYQESSPRRVHGRASKADVEELRDEGIDVLDLLVFSKTDEELN